MARPAAERQQTRSKPRRDPSKLTYEWYINSAAWDRRKAAYYSRHPKKCRACGDTENIHLHHHTYTRLGAEHDDDLIPLCKDHHDTVHRLHRSADNKFSLTQATRAVIGGPLHPARQRQKPRDSVKRQRSRGSRKIKKKTVSPPPPPKIAPLLIGERVIVTPESSILSWAKGRHGTVREATGPTSWTVELDGMPLSRMAVTLTSIRRENARR